MTTQNNSTKTNIKKVVATIGKWMPLHNGHKTFLIKLAKDSSIEKLIIMIGSCYEMGDLKHSITATEREKMIRAVMKREEIPESKFEIVPIPDYHDFEKWIFDVLEVCQTYNVTHFCTGNREDILDVLEKKHIDLGLKFINPENQSSFPYHATDIRNMLIAGNFEEVRRLIPDEVAHIFFRHSYKTVIAASQHKAISYIPGRQTVDVTMLVKNSLDGKIYALLGTRNLNQSNFPGCLAFPGGPILKYESSINSAIRVLKEETGIKVRILDNSLEPAIIRFEDMPHPSIEQMHVSGIYGSKDIHVNGDKGGSTQSFTIIVEGNVEEYSKLIIPSDHLLDVKFYDVEQVVNKQFAFEHRSMLITAINMLGGYPRFQRN